MQRKELKPPPRSAAWNRLHQACVVAGNINRDMAITFDDTMLGLYPDVIMPLFLKDKEMESLADKIEAENNLWTSFEFPPDLSPAEKRKLWYTTVVKGKLI